MNLWRGHDEVSQELCEHDVLGKGMEIRRES